MFKQLLTLGAAAALLIPAAASVSASSEGISQGTATFSAGDLMFVEPDGEGSYAAGQGVPSFVFQGDIVPRVFDAPEVGGEHTIRIFDGRGGDGRWRLDVSKSLFINQFGLELEGAYIQVDGGQVVNREDEVVSVLSMGITTTPQTLIATEGRALGLSHIVLDDVSLANIDGTMGLSAEDYFESVLTWTLLDVVPN